jgi:hypothetical protein
MGRRLTAIIAALVMLSMTLAFSAATGTVEAKESKDLKMVEERDIDVTSSFTLQELASSELVALLPPDVLGTIDPQTEVTIHLDGMLHVNALAWEKKDALDIDAHVAWHGSIVLQIGEGPELAFEFKNAQLKVSASVPSSQQDLDLKVNFHINGQLSVDGVEAGLDLSTHVLLKLNDGQITSFKLWLPGLGGEYLLDL